jgi:hypothetical protein
MYRAAENNRRNTCTGPLDMADGNKLTGRNGVPAINGLIRGVGWIIHHRPLAHARSDYPASVIPIRAASMNAGSLIASSSIS